MGDFPLYWLTKFALPPVVAALGLCQDWQLFVCIYVLIDIVLGIGDVSERTLLHAAMEDAYRASMLSVYSLALRIGVVISSVSAAVIVPKLGSHRHLADRTAFRTGIANRAIPDGWDAKH